jgi:hypothetical protein
VAVVVVVVVVHFCKEMNDPAKNETKVMTQWAILRGITASVQTLSIKNKKILLPDFHAKLRRQHIFKPTNGNESSHNGTNDNGAKVVKHNSQLLKVTVV